MALREIVLYSMIGAAAATGFAQSAKRPAAKQPVKVEDDGAPIKGKIIELYPPPQKYLEEYLGNHDDPFDRFAFLYTNESGVGCAWKILPDDQRYSTEQSNRLRQLYWDAVLAHKNGTLVSFVEDPAWHEDNCKRLLEFRVLR